MSNASRAAALASLGQDIPNIFSNVVGAYRTTKDRKEAMKDKELEREMMGLRMEGAKKDLIGKDMQNKLASLSLGERKEAVNKLKEVDDFLSKQENVESLKMLVKKANKEVGSDPLLASLAKEEGGLEGQFPGVDFKAQPKSRDEVMKPVAERYQNVSDIAKGEYTGIKGREDAIAKAEQDALDRERAIADKKEERGWNEEQNKIRFGQQKELEGIRQTGRVNLLETKTDLTPEKNPSSAQFQAATFATRISQSENTLDNLMGKGFDPTSVKNRVIEKGDLTAIKDPEQRQYAQAARNFINATLRRESGAAIAESEFVSARKQYFPQIGDDPETVEQKKQNRLAIMAGLKAEAGGAYGQVQQELQGLNSPKQSDLRGKYGY
jgi:hypothetical protein